MKQLIAMFIVLSMFSHAWTCSQLSPANAPITTDSLGVASTPDIILDNVHDELISTEAELIDFFLYGTEPECTLSCDIDVKFNMLKLTKDRGHITINGGGYTISGSAECLIRMDDDTSLALNDIHLSSSAICIAIQGSGSIAATDLSIESEFNCFDVFQTLTLKKNSDLLATSTSGYGVAAAGFILENGVDAVIHSLSSASTVSVSHDGLLLTEGSSLTASGYGYNVLSCDSTVTLLDDSKLDVKNIGTYHACEIYSIYIEGTVEINAIGGENGVGIFIAMLTENYHVIGECTPDLRKEKGLGSIHFYESADLLPSPEPLSSTPQ
ncbi:MAG: hypothetical protein IJA35_01780 [Clostridia bacterium]|nr:hypothetical protein [Clostridia bacterium]